MKKASVLIIVSVLLAALLCLAGCSSDVEYTDEETGVTVSLPGSWEEDSDSEGDGYFLAFSHRDSQYGYSEIIDCLLVGKSSYVNITDYSKDYIRDSYSGFEVDDVEEKELSSGTYYEVTGSSDDAYFVEYVTIENNNLIQFSYSSESADTPHLSDFEEMVDNAEFGPSSSDVSESSTSSDESASSSHTWGSKDTSLSVVGDPDLGIIGYMSSSDWRIASVDDLEELGFDSDTFAYCSCDNGSSSEYILGQKFSGYKGEKITDYPKEAISEMYSESMSVDSVKKKKLDSGTYYVTKGTGENNNYFVIYEIIKKGYDIRFTYVSTGGESDTPHLSDFKDMVDGLYFSKD